MKPKVSIIVPIYKAEQYLETCIESLVNQTLENIEIILVNDGSPDSSGDICNKYKDMYSNIKAIHLKNGGVSRARNYGIVLAEGEYIGFVDSDDYVDLDMYKILYDIAIHNESDIVMCGIKIDNGDKHYNIKMNYCNEYSGNKTIIENLINLYYQNEHPGLFSVCNKIFRKELVDKYSITFDQELSHAEDAFYVLDFLKKSEKFNCINEYYYNYRQVDSSCVHQVSRPNDYERHKTYRLRLLKEASDIGVKFDYCQFYSDFLFSTVLFCRDMVTIKEYEYIKRTFNDDFFQNACHYHFKLPFHIKLICNLAKARMYSLAILLLIIWNVVLKIK